MNTPASEAAISPLEEETRIAAMEKARDAPFTEAQRQRLAGRLRDLDESSAARRQFPLSDGGDEPCFVFRPVR